MSADNGDRLDRIERMLEQTAARQQELTELVVQTAERQSVTEHQIEQLSSAIDRLSRATDRLHSAVEIDAENIRRLANVAAAHDARLDSHDSRLDEIEGGETG